jgi:hypothetical protein
MGTEKRWSVVIGSFLVSALAMFSSATLFIILVFTGDAVEPTVMAWWAMCSVSVGLLFIMGAVFMDIARRSKLSFQEMFPGEIKK